MSKRKREEQKELAPEEIRDHLEVLLYEHVLEELLENTSKRYVVIKGCYLPHPTEMHLRIHSTCCDESEDIEPDDVVIEFTETDLDAATIDHLGGLVKELVAEETNIRDECQIIMCIGEYIKYGMSNYGKLRKRVSMDDDDDDDDDKDTDSTPHEKTDKDDTSASVDE